MAGIGRSEADALEARLRQHSTCFAAMVELIPAKYYIVRDEDAHPENKYWQNKKLKAPKQAVKEATKRAKRLKLDPKRYKSVVELKQEADREEGEEGGKEIQADDQHLEGESESESEGEEMEGTNNGQLIKELEPEVEVKVKKITYNKGISVEKVKSGDLNELRDRLKHRLADLRRKRKASESENPDEQVQKRRKRMDSKQLRQERKKRLKERKSKKKHVSEKEGSKPLVKDESGEVVFSKFDFSTPTRDWEPEHKKQHYQKLLAKAEAKEKRLEMVKQRDEEAATELNANLNWERALEMAGGTKPKDDPKLLKKTIKGLEKKKAKSRKDWDERAQQERQMKDKRQETRKKHVQERIQQIRAKKVKRANKKRGSTRRPGF